MPRSYVMTPQQGSVTLIINMGGANNSQGGSGAEVQTLTLPITPEDIQITRPSRQAVTQTLTSAYQDHLGSGITTVSMRGHTGWRNLTSEGDGFQIIKKLRDLLGQYEKIVATDRPDKVSLQLLLSLPSGWEHFRVSKTTATYTRSRAQPLLYRYEIQFIVLKDFNDATGQTDPSPNFIIQQGIFPDVQLVDVTFMDTAAKTTLLPDTSTTKDVAAQTIVNQTMTRGHENDEFGPFRASTSDVQITLAQFTDRQYPPWPNGTYPGGMYNYIVAANPSFFKTPLNPQTYLLYPLDVLWVPYLDAADVVQSISGRGTVTSSDVKSYVGKGGQGFINFTNTIGGITTTTGIPNYQVAIPGLTKYRGWDISDPPTD